MVVSKLAKVDKAIKAKKNKAVDEVQEVVQIPKASKYVFVLVDIDPIDLDDRYGIAKSNIGKVVNPPMFTTSVTDLAPSNNSNTVSFFDEAKTMHKCVVSMIDFSSKTSPQGLDPEQFCCFWDRCPCPKGITPIGCPIRYVSNQVKKSYFSEISRDNYSIIENITVGRKEKLKTNGIVAPLKAKKTKVDSTMTLKHNAYYETDGVFCSWNCAMSFAKDNRTNPLYRMSVTLLLKMYNDFNGTYNTVIESAPHWRLLKGFGGRQSIEEFRSTFSKVDYEDHGLVGSFRPMATLIEERLRF